MAEKTGIAWTDSTFNPWIGCTKVGPGCDHCYAEALMDKRWHRVQWGPHGQRQRTSAANWRQPLLWEREHEAFALMHGRRRRVFCASLADVFDNAVPDAWRADLFNLIADTPHLDWLLLTKRIGNARAMLDAFCESDGHKGERWDGWPNVWLGATVVNQEEADRDIPKLLATPAAVRFLSIEPMLGPVDLTRWLSRCDHGSRPGPGGIGGVMCAECHGHGHGCMRLHWVIAGGESGPSARPMHPDWARSLRDQCAAAGVPFFFKQMGGVTAAAGGCELDGVEAKAWPSEACTTN